LVVGDEIEHRVAFGGGVLRVRADVQVQPGPVLQEHVRGPAPVDHATEEIPGDLVRGQPPLPPERAGHAVFVLQAEDAPVHALSVGPAWSFTRTPPAGPGAGWAFL